MARRLPSNWNQLNRGIPSFTMNRNYTCFCRGELGFLI
uniref:Uncharacterized protein n=1 Tax=Arundo donax TaxID=35708 RepID=A0A0A9E639_ARUDO